MNIDEAKNKINYTVYNKAIEIDGVIKGVDTVNKGILVSYNDAKPILTSCNDLILINKKRID